ncbi:glucoamylase family protein [Robertkochia solimangrovi]|uniref:glucoamylase family protein n=1 Tax=Robertkochia solimangrovi TaxID=2213046 RepID=UPI00117EE23A|nr:glucoamylase family protein [Robertkochia solimangrovi]TRZ43661.1 beta-glucosidase [Robertkochia solimangrovi]
MKCHKFLVIFFTLILWSCSSSDDSNPCNEPGTSGLDCGGDNGGDESLSDEEIMDLVQEQTLRYFWDYAESESGAARERYLLSNPDADAHVVATGGTGFGIMAIIAGVERGFISIGDAESRFAKILDFLESADRFHGAWPHWIDGRSGAVIPFSSLDDGGDIVETAFLVQGLITLAEYLREGTSSQQELSGQAEALWKGVEWDWYTNGTNTLYWHWSPNNGFAIGLPLKGYNETLIAYVLAAASPEHGITKDVYDNGWADNGNIISSNSKYGYPLLVKHQGNEAYGGPLFWAHYSYLGLDPRRLSDGYANYMEVNGFHTLINYQYCVENSKGFADYGEDCWGLTASYSRNNDGSLGYSAHSPANDTGVISPTAAISSIPYTPEHSLAAMHYFYKNRTKLLGPAGFYDAFSPEFDFWVAQAYLAIDQGPQIIMIENYRSGLLWDLFMKNTDVTDGLDLLGFNY